MKVSDVNINKSIQSISFYLVQRMSREDGCSEEDALKKLLRTSTYELLYDKESGLYAESPEYVWSMLKEEEKGNMEAWRKK
ncbi:MAG: hypothetical protein LUE16_02640 [Lachnospiraceae bacterium]|nr:hypothetical protein [Lachnospiraceae bacterium]